MKSSKEILKMLGLERFVKLQRCLDSTLNPIK